MPDFDHDAHKDSLAREQWCSGAAECIACGHRWAAVWPLAALSLQCPACGSKDTDRAVATVRDRGCHG